MIEIESFQQPLAKKYLFLGDGKSTGIIAIGRPADVAFTRPFESHTGLFLEFADLDLTESAVEKFVGRFGTLGLYHEDEPALELGILAGQEVDSIAERVEEWFEEILKIRKIVERYEIVAALAAGDREKLGRLGFEVLGLSAAELARRYQEMSSEFADELDAGLDSVRKHIVESVSFDVESRRFKIVKTPRSLLGGMWLQLLVKVIGSIEHRQCRTCGRWFSITPDTNRSQKIFCSQACKSKDYRDRKKRVLELTGQGMTDDEIADVTGVELKSVVRWVRKEHEDA